MLKSKFDHVYIFCRPNEHFPLLIIISKLSKMFVSETMQWDMLDIGYLEMKI